MLLIRKLAGFFNQSFMTQWLLLPAWLLTGISRLLVLCVPFRFFAPYLGRHHGIAAFIPLLNDKQQMRALSIGRAVRMASTMAPWNANCQAQAITARCLLGFFKVPYAVFYGVASAPGQVMKAHAWVCSGLIQVTGGYAFDEFTVVAVFSNAAHDLNRGL